MDRAKKAETIDAIKAVFDAAGAVIVTHYMGITVAQAETLRSRLRAEGAAFRVVKNRLAQKALGEDADADAVALFKGPSAIAYGPDPVTAAKIAVDYAKENEHFVIIGGMMGAQVLNAEGVEALAKLPSLDQLRANLVGLIQTPATRIAGVVQAPAAQLARVFNAYATKDAA